MMIDSAAQVMHSGTTKPPVSHVLEVLLVEDEPLIGEAIQEALEDRGHRVTYVTDGAVALAELTSRVFDVLITDIRIPQFDGHLLFKHVREHAPSTDVILMSAFGSVDEAVSSIKNSAAYYFSKPLDLDALVKQIDEIVTKRAMKREMIAAASRGSGDDPEWSLVGQSPAMVALRERIEASAGSDAAVLVLGETGTGKELVARALHRASARYSGPFVAVNCAAFPDTLLEAELFGHEKGAFTGATQRRQGRIAAAEGGTLFLDEVGDMSPAAQAKMLRVLQEGTYEPLGTNATTRANVRIISATHADLRKRVDERSFRMDLYFRIKVLQLTCPPLRQRRSDIALLATHFYRIASQDPLATPRFAPDAWEVMLSYPFPGNVRELAHAIEHAYVLTRGAEIRAEHLPEDLRLSGDRAPSDDPSGAYPNLRVALRNYERQYILRALAANGGNRTATAEALGLSRRQLWNKLHQYGIEDADPED